MKNIRKVLLTFFVLIFSYNLSYSQTISIPDTLRGWDYSWLANLNGSQASYSNWSQGGVSSISGTASTVFTALTRADKWAYGFRVNMKYGQSHVKGEGVRKTDDLFSVRNRLTYPLDKKGVFLAYASVWFRTQFDDGYDYGGAVAGGDSLISGFMAPAYVTEGVGVAYKPENYITFEAGLALKQTYVKNESLAPNYGLEEGETFRSEGGFTTGISFQNEVAKNIHFSSSLETFTNVNQSFSKTDVYWANELVGKINEIVNATFQFEIRYDDDFSSELQVKEVLSAGVSVNLF